MPIASADPAQIAASGTHPYGLSVIISEIDVRPLETVLTVAITNGNPEPVFLQEKARKTFIEDAEGNKLFLNTGSAEALSVDGQSAAEGKLVFIGPLATSGNAKLVFNSDGDDDDDQDNPRLVIDLPIADVSQGQEATPSGTTEKKSPVSSRSD